LLVFATYFLFQDLPIPQTLEQLCVEFGIGFSVAGNFIESEQQLRPRGWRRIALLDGPRKRGELGKLFDVSLGYLHRSLEEAIDQLIVGGYFKRCWSKRFVLGHDSASLDRVLRVPRMNQAIKPRAGAPKPVYKQ
jgi:hypothetical protein